VGTRDVAARRALVDSVLLIPCLSTIFSKNLNRSGQNSIVVDLNTPYNFHKGQIVFFSIDFAGEVCQL
jgi:hypothetical protein